MRKSWLLMCLVAFALAAPSLAASAQPDNLPRVVYAAPVNDPAQNTDDEIDLGDDVASEDAIDVGTDEEVAEGEIDLGQTDVQGQSQAAPGDTPIGAISEVITSAEIEQSGAESLGGVLARESGFTVNDTFAGSEVTFQGLPSKFTTVLIDGQRVPGHIFERIDFSQLPMANIERVEIIRGPQAAAYGSDSAGVVVNLITKQGTGTHGSLTLGLGSLGYNHQHLSLNGGDSRQNWLFAFERRLRERYDLNNFAPDTDGDSFRQHDFLGKYQRLFGNDRLTFQFDSFTEDATGISFAPPDQLRMNETFTRRIQGTISYDWDLGKNRSLEFAHNYGTYYHNLHRFYAGYEDSSAVDTGFKDTLQDTHLNFQQYKKNFVFNAGAERNWDRLESDRIGANGVAQAEELAAYTTLEYYRGKRWIFTGALRLDAHDLFGEEVSPKVSAQYKLGHEATLTAAVGRGQRFPSLRERYYEFASPFGYSVIGNANLEPETAWSYNLDYDRSTKHGYVKLGAFRHDISDMIVFSQIQDNPQVFQTENVGHARSAGLQLASERRWRLGCPECSTEFLGAGYDVTWIADSQDTELGTKLVNSPQWDQRFRLFFEQPRLNAEMLLRNTSARYFDRENNTRAPAFTTVDLNFSGPLNSGEWRLAGLNILDRKNGKYGPEPGREIRLEYTLNF